MKSALAIVAALAIFAVLGGARATEVDQIAQQKMIGLSKKIIRICMGAPAQRVAIGSTDIWTYRSASAVVEGLFLASGVDGMASWVRADKLCNVNIVMTNARVSQIILRRADGRPLPLGEHCLFAVDLCVRLVLHVAPVVASPEARQHVVADRARRARRIRRCRSSRPSNSRAGAGRRGVLRADR